MNILIIRPGAIGDALLTFPVVSVLRLTYPDSHITFVGNAAVLPLALEWGLVEEVFDFQSPLWSKLFSTKGIQDATLLERLQAIDLAICWLRDDEHLVERNLHAAGVKRCIIAPGRPPENAHMHIVDYLLNTVFGSHPHTIEWHHMEGGWDASNTQYRIAVHPGSGGRQKCWPMENFAAVIRELWRRGWPVMVLTGPADEEQRDYLRQQLGPPAPEMLEWVENAPLTEVARRLRQCRCYLGNDSGVTHLAALLGLPTVALFGPSDPLTWRPVGERVRVIYEPLLANVAVDMVLAQIEQALHDELPM